MHRLLIILYFLGWIFCFCLYGTITYNRRTKNSLGLYDVLRSPFDGLLDTAVGISLLLIPLLSIVTLCRLRRWSWLRPLEIALVIGAWGLFLYNLSFYRG